MTLFIIIVSVLMCTCVTGSGITGSSCIKHKSCGTCIAAGCFWCLKENYTLSPCNSAVNLSRNGCEDAMLSAAHSYHNHSDGSVHLSPNNITIRMRPGTNITFPVTFHQAKDYPVDLYFLMDVSFSMKELRNRLVDLSETLATTLQNLTKNYQLGLGTFVDKMRMPYVNVEKLYSWCPRCSMEPHSFKNYLPLTANVSTFRNTMNSTGVSANLDNPESVLDALMQTIVCTEHIGWRNLSRKLVVVSTDGEFHYAGDGMLGGLIESNDGECYLNKNGEVNNSNYQDYPSISQLARKVVDKNINVIFAIVEQEQQVYEALKERIQGSSVGILTSNFSNVITLIKENYQNISGTVRLMVKSDDEVSVTFQSKCLGQDLKEQSVCEGVRVGQNVVFNTTVHVNLTSCPVDESKWIKTLYINPFGLNEKLTINVELDCRCSCEKPEHKELNSTSCNGNGARVCGLCACNEGFYGNYCECSHSYDDKLCRSNSSNQRCEGRGKCYCGKCECEKISSTQDKLYSGKFCECDDSTCGYYNDEPCGGDKRGVCECGKCNCRDEWEGDRCQCPRTALSPCMKNGKICNDKGVCNCGKCSCTTSTFFTGPTCDACQTCTERCDQYRPCVKCYFTSADASRECAADCPANVHPIDTFEVAALNITMECDVFLDDECNTTFTYNDELDVLSFIGKKSCTKQENLSYIVMGVVIGILAVGLALLCTWKAFVTLHDRREYERFMEEKQKTTFSSGENPLYKQATSTYKNPAFSSGKQ